MVFDQRTQNVYLHFSKNRQGFSLLEILIAITLLGFLMIGVYSMIDNSTRTRENTLLEDKEFVEAETALYRLEVDFSLFYTPLLYSVRYNPAANQNSSNTPGAETSKNSSLDKYEATERFPYVSKKALPIPALSNENKSSLAFFYSGNKRNFESTKESNFGWVKYALKNQEGEPNLPGLQELVRYHIPGNPYAADFEWEDSSASVLLRNVKSLEFQFWEPQRKVFVDSLRGSNSDQNLIRILKVVLEWVDRHKVEHKIERLFRIAWPVFDTIKDDAEYTKALQLSVSKEGSGSGTVPSDLPPEE